MPNLPIEYDGSSYDVTTKDLELWANIVLALEYPEIENDISDVYLMVRTWLSAYSAKFSETNFDNAPLWLDVSAWLKGYVDYLEGIY